MEKVDLNELRKHFIFQLFDDDELTQLIAYFNRRAYFDSHAVFHEKERGESMLIILKGEVLIMREGGDIIATLREGDFFGEVALFDYALRTAGAVAQGDVVLLEITRTDFNNLFNCNKNVAAKLLYQMMTEMSRRLRQKNNPTGGITF